MQTKTITSHTITPFLKITILHPVTLLPRTRSPPNPTFITQISTALFYKRSRPSVFFTSLSSHIQCCRRTTLDPSDSNSTQLEVGATFRNIHLPAVFFCFCWCGASFVCLQIMCKFPPCWNIHFHAVEASQRTSPVLLHFHLSWAFSNWPTADVTAEFGVFLPLHLPHYQLHWLPWYPLLFFFD